jgi:hypothetical protein
MSMRPEGTVREASMAGIKGNQALRELFHRIQHGVTAASAKAVASVTNAGHQQASFLGTEAMMAADMQTFAKNVVVEMVKSQQADAAGKISAQAIKNDASSLVTELSRALLTGGNAEAASQVSATFWDAAMDAQLPPHAVAASMVPAVIDAVESGHDGDVAFVQKRLVELGKSEMGMWLLVVMVRDFQRGDIVARSTWTGIKTMPEGADVAVKIGALAMQHGFNEELSEVSVWMYRYARMEGMGSKAADVIATTAAAITERGMPDCAVAVSEGFLKRDQPELVHLTMVSLVERGKADEVAKISLAALRGKLHVQQAFDSQLTERMPLVESRTL